MMALVSSILSITTKKRLVLSSVAITGQTEVRKYVHTEMSGSNQIRPQASYGEAQTTRRQPKVHSTLLMPVGQSERTSERLDYHYYPRPEVAVDGEPVG